MSAGGPIISQFAPVTWNANGSGTIQNPVAGETNILPATPGAYYAIMGLRYQIAENTFAGVAGAYQVGIVVKSGATVVPIHLSAVYVPAAALVASGSLYDTGWMRFDPLGLGGDNEAGYELDFYTGVALTGLISFVIAWQSVPAG